MATAIRLYGGVFGLLALQLAGAAVGEEGGGLFPRGGPLVLFGAPLTGESPGGGPFPGELSPPPLLLRPLVPGMTDRRSTVWAVGGGADWVTEPGGGRLSAIAIIGYLPAPSRYREGEVQWGAEVALADFVPNHRIGLTYTEVDGVWRSSEDRGVGAWGGRYGLGISAGQWLEAGVRQERNHAAPDLTDYYLRWRLDL